MTKIRYTISRKADKKVQQDLEIIKKIIIKRLKPESIILSAALAGAKEALKSEMGKFCR